MTRIIKSLGCDLGKRLLGPGSEMSEKKCHQCAKFDFQRRDSAQSGSRAYLHSGKTMFAGPREGSRKISQTQTTLE